MSNLAHSATTRIEVPRPEEEEEEAEAISPSVLFLGKRARNFLLVDVFSATTQNHIHKKVQ